MRRPLQEQLLGPGGGQAKSVRSEMLRWHLEKFNGRALGKGFEGDQEAVKEAAERVVHILTTFKPMR